MSPLAPRETVKQKIFLISKMPWKQEHAWQVGAPNGGNLPRSPSHEGSVRVLQG